MLKSWKVSSRTPFVNLLPLWWHSAQPEPPCATDFVKMSLPRSTCAASVSVSGHCPHREGRRRPPPEERRRGALAQQHLAVAGRGVGHEVVVQALVPLGPVVGDVLVLRADLRAADGVGGDVPLAAVLPAVPVAEAAGLLPVVR